VTDMKHEYYLKCKKQFRNTEV